ncbi:MAG: DUF2341 domain-containing protein [Proteobacteria bacterium]|nr:DUF2341 domain-containing protein [Pseudomonadota bacterium]
MVKIINQFGDVKKGKQHTAVYQNIYGNQMRRTLKDKKDEHTKGQLEQRERFKVGIDFAKGLTKAQRDFIKSYMADAGIRSPDGLPTTWYSFTKKIAMTRPKVEMETEADEEFAAPYTNWSYRRPITLNNTTGGELTNHQVLITLTTENFTYANCKNDGSDIRYSASNKTTPLNYKIKDWNYNGTSKIWVKVNSIPTGENICLYLYYGNNEAESESNGGNTSPLFEDFEDGDYTNDPPGTKYGTGTSIVETPGYNSDYLARFTPNASNIVGIEYSLSPNLPAGDYHFSFDRYGCYGQCGISDRIHFVVLKDSSELYHYLKSKPGCQGGQQCPEDFWQEDASNFTISESANKIRIYGNRGSWSGNWKVDNIHIRKYATPEPSVSGLGNEEEAGSTYTLSKLVIHHPAIKSYKIKSGETTIKSEENISNLEDRITTSILAKNLDLTATKIIVKTLANQEYEFNVK